jgi:hypothetical protein
MKKIYIIVLIILLTTYAYANLRVFTEIRIKLNKGVDKTEFDEIEKKYMNTDIEGEGYIVNIVKTDFSPNVYLRLAEKNYKYVTMADVEIEIPPDNPQYTTALNLEVGQRLAFTAKLINISDTTMYFAGNVILEVK